MPSVVALCQKQLKAIFPEAFLRADYVCCNNLWGICQKDFLPRVTANIFILNYVKDVQIGLLFVFLQLCQQIGKGASAMAYGVFLFGRGFGKTFPKVVAVKQTVIPETAVSCFGK